MEQFEKQLSIDDAAEILYELFGDECACNYNGIDEWLPMRCAYGETMCPSPPKHLDCWRQYVLARLQDKRESKRRIDRYD